MAQPILGAPHQWYRHHGVHSIAAGLQQDLIVNGVFGKSGGYIDSPSYLPGDSDTLVTAAWSNSSRTFSASDRLPNTPIVGSLSGDTLYVQADYRSGPRTNTGLSIGASLSAAVDGLFIGGRLGIGQITGMPDTPQFSVVYAAETTISHIRVDRQTRTVVAAINSDSNQIFLRPAPGHPWRTIALPVNIGGLKGTKSSGIEVLAGVIPDDQATMPECPAPCPAAQVGQPINTATGALWTSSTDLTVPGPGPALTWSRTYQSAATDQPVGSLGVGWQHTFATRVITPTMPGGEAETLIVVSPKGNRWRYTQQADGSYRAVPGVYSTLVATSSTITQTLRDQSQSVYEATTGRLIAQRDAQGRTLALTYDGDRLTRIHDTANPQRQLLLGYNPAQTRITSVSDGVRTITYAYDGADDLVEWRDVMARSTTYTYQTHLLIRVENALGQILEHTEYEQPALASSRAISQTLHDGTRLNLTYLDATTVMTTTGTDGRIDVDHYDYSANRTLQRVLHNGQVAQQIGTNGAFAPGVVGDANGNVTTQATNAYGQPLQITNALGEATAISYDSANRPITITDTLGRRTELAYDTDNNLIRQTTGITTATPLGFTSLFTYSNTFLTAQQGPDGVVTSYARDADGRVTATTVGAGTALAQTTSYGYDALGRVNTTTVGVGTALQRRDVTEYYADNTVARTIQNYVDGVFDSNHPDEDIITSYGYDALGRQVWVQDVLGRVDATHYNAQGQVDWTIRNLAPAQFSPQGEPVFQAFDPATPDANVATRYGYDGLGRTTLVTETGILTGTVDPATRTFSGATTRTTRTEYDAQSRPVTVTLNYQPGGAAGPDVNVQTISQYDAAGNLTWQRDALNRWTHTEYDALNRPITVTLNVENGDPLTVDAANQAWATITDTDIIQVTTYGPDGQLASTIDGYGDGVFDPLEPDRDRKTVYEYDDLGRQTRVIANYVDGDPATGGTDTDLISETIYDSLGRVQATQDPLGQYSSLVYDTLGRVEAQIQNCRAGGVPAATGCDAFDPQYPDRNVRTSTSFDDLGRAYATTDARGMVQQTAFDGVGRRIRSIANYVDGSFDPQTPDADVITTWRYDGLGRMLSSTDPTGVATSTSYDALGRRSSHTDGASRTHRQGSDAAGTRWQADPAGRLTVTQIDGLGRVVVTIANYDNGSVDAGEPVDQDLITRTVYDAGGRRIATIDAAGRETRFAYDLRDNLIRVTENASDSGCAVAPCNVVTQYAYDRMGNRIRITDANQHRRTSGYDAADRPVTVTDALGQTTTTSYDRRGRITSTDDPRGAADDVQYTYDELGRLTGMSATNLAAPITMGYDAGGRRTTLGDATGTTSVAYDNLGRITGVTAPGTGTVGYAYTARGERAQLRYPDGTVIDYAYWGDGQLRAVRAGTTVLADYAYDAGGRLATLTRSNGAVTTSTYDNAHRLTDLHTTVGGTTAAQFSYTLDRLGLRLGVTETLSGTVRSITYTYDGLLRLTSAVEDPGTSYTYAYDLAGNRTEVWENGVQTQSQSYNAANQVIGWSDDAAGNLLSDGTHIYEYDALSRQVSRDGATYAYNGDGVLVQAGATAYTLDLAAPLSQVLHDGTSSYIYGNDAERLRAVGGAWYIPDALGSVRATLDDSGAVLASTNYDPWGLPQASAIAPFGFTGEVQDAAGMVYLRARWYDAGSGRFGVRDPFVGFPEVPYSQHEYQYGYSNPVLYTDPSGRCVFTGVDTLVCAGVALTIYEAIAIVAAAGIATAATYDICITQGYCDRLARDVQHARGYAPPQQPLPDIGSTPVPAPAPMPAPHLSPDPSPTPTLEIPGAVIPQDFVCPMPAPTPTPATPVPSPTPLGTPTPTPDSMSVFKPGADTPQTTKHIMDAIAGGKPSIVTYRGAYNGYSRGWLRTAPACRGQSRSLWCDEYPFNSVDEGGQANQPSLRLVPAPEQRVQAGKWTSFLNRCRVVAGEKVKIEPGLARPETTWTCK